MFAIAGTIVAIIGIVWFVHFALTTDLKGGAVPARVIPPARRGTHVDPAFGP